MAAALKWAVEYEGNIQINLNITDEDGNINHPWILYSRHSSVAEKNERFIFSPLFSMFFLGKVNMTLNVYFLLHSPA